MAGESKVLFILFLALSFLIVWHEAECKITGYQPVDLGMTFSTPLNLAGTLQNSVAGPISVILATVFASVLFIGLFLPNKPIARSWDSSNWYKVILNELDVEDSFGFLGDERDACKRKVLCHLHSFLPSSPTWLQTIFRIISRGVMGTAKYKEDILRGLVGGSDCLHHYNSDCPESMGQLLVNSVPIRRFLQSARSSSHNF